MLRDILSYTDFATNVNGRATMDGLARDHNYRSIQWKIQACADCQMHSANVCWLAIFLLLSKMHCTCRNGYSNMKGFIQLVDK